MKIQVVEKDNLPNFQLLLVFEEGDNREAFIRSIQTESVQERLKSRTLYGEYLRESLNTSDLGHYITLDASNVVLIITDFKVVEGGILIDCCLKTKLSMVEDAINYSLVQFKPRMLYTTDKAPDAFKYYFIAIDMYLKESVKWEKIQP